MTLPGTTNLDLMHGSGFISLISKSSIFENLILNSNSIKKSTTKNENLLYLKYIRDQMKSFEKLNDTEKKWLSEIENFQC